MFIRLKILLLDWCLSLLAPFYRWKHGPFSPPNGKKRLVIIRNDFMGDFVVFLPAALALKQALPDYYITILITEPIAEWAKKCPAFDEVLVLRPAPEKLPLIVRLRQFLIMRTLNAEVLINALHGRNGDTDLLAFASPAKRKYAFGLGQWTHPQRERIVFYERFYSEVVAFAPQTPIAELYRQLLEKATGKTISLSPVPPHTWEFLKDKEKQVAAEDYAVIVPGANDCRRRWPIESFVTVVRDLQKAFPKIVWLVTGTAKEQALGQILANEVHAENFCGRLSLPQLAALLANARLVISNDTGSSHLASLLGVATLTILGGGHFGVYAPCPLRPSLIAIFKSMPCYNCNWKCEQGDCGTYPCVSAVSPYEIISRAVAVLRRAMPMSSSITD